MPWFSRRSLHCFGCGQHQPYNSSMTSVPVNGNIALIWRCQNCDYRNICAQDTGDHIDDVPEHFYQTQTKQYADSLDLPTNRSIFCKTCIHNQQLQMTLLAAHIPSDDAPDFAERYASAESFKRNLELQYPSVCDRCAPIVQEELERQKRNSRQQALNAMIRRSSDVNPTVVQAHSRGLRRHLPAARVAVTAVFLIYCLLATMRPQMSNILETQVLTFMLASMAILPLNVAAENSHRVTGQGTYSLLQVLLFAWRSSIIYFLGKMTPTNGWYRPVAQIGIVVAVVLTLLASTTLREVTRRRINLVGSRADFSVLNRQNGIAHPEERLMSMNSPTSPSTFSAPPSTFSTSPTTFSSSPSTTRPKSSPTLLSRPSGPINKPINQGTDEMDWVSTSHSHGLMPEYDEEDSPFARVANDPSVLTNSSGSLSFGFSNRRQNHFKNRGDYKLPPRTRPDEAPLAQTFFGSEKATGLEDLFTQTLAIKDDSGLVEHVRRFGKALYGHHSSTSRWATFWAAFAFALASSSDAFGHSRSTMSLNVVKIIPPLLTAFACYHLGRYRGDLIKFMGFRQPTLSTEEFQQEFSAKASQILLTRRLQQLLIARVLLFALQMNWHKAISLQDTIPSLLDTPIWNSDVSAMPGFILDAFTMVTVLTQWKRPAQPQ